VSKYACILSEETAAQLEEWAESLTAELFRIEDKLINDLSLCKNLRLDKPLVRAFINSRGYERNNHVRLMRYDFHPVKDSEMGWALSEVNSDVPCGFAESVLLPGLAKEYFADTYVRGNVADSLYQSFIAKLKYERIAFVHATSYSDDRQVLQYLYDYFKQRGIDGIFAAPDHIKWDNGKAISAFDNREIGGIIRSYPAEWLHMFKKKCWSGFFDSDTVQCNHPAAVLTQSKRLPLIWDESGLELPTWRKLLPQTVAPARNAPLLPEDEWLYKYAMGRVGDGISMKGAVSDKEMSKISKAVKRYPNEWVAQKKFRSLPLGNDNLHLCAGVFTVDGKAAGFFGRAGNYNLIDGYAADIPILVTAKKLKRSTRNAD
jgi:glutathionylspermidine synthase